MTSNSSYFVYYLSLLADVLGLHESSGADPVGPGYGPQRAMFSTASNSVKKLFTSKTQLCPQVQLWIMAPQSPALDPPLWVLIMKEEKAYRWHGLIF